MRKFSLLDGLVVPLDRANVDTDAIIPKQFLKSIKRAGFGPNLFDEWRYLDRGEPGQDPAARRANPDFVLNQPRYAGASILLVRKNFGCGSSREHAPWALVQYGFRALLAPSYADIFYNNSLKNGLLPVVVDEATHEWLLAHPGAEVEIDLATSTLRLPDGRSVGFPVEAFSRYCLMNGIDELGYLLGQAPAIERFEAARGAR